MDGNEEKPIRNIEVTNFHVDKAERPYYLIYTENIAFKESTVNGVAVPEYPEESTERQSCDVW